MEMKWNKLVLAITTFLYLLIPIASAQAQSPSIDQQIDNAIAPLSNFIASIVFYSVNVTDDLKVPIVVIWLIICAIFCTFYFTLIQVRGFSHAIDLVRGKYSDPNDPGQISHFQALATALSGTVGLGNIAGVAVAVSLGGPGATFWMITAGLLGMATKFCECTLGVRYRQIDENGRVSGGPMYYLSKGLAEKGLGGIGKVLAVIFAVLCIGGALGAGNMFQANQSFHQVLNVTGGQDSALYGFAWGYGLIMAVLVAAVIIGGIKSIAQTTAKIVPLMAVIYVGAALLIILLNYDKVGWAFSQIINGAFSPEGVTGGVVGVLIMGFQRAAFSNEAGFGSAAIAHSAVQTKEPATEGIVALLEPFIDTVVICTMTALVIIITGQLGPDSAADTWDKGVVLTSNAFASAFTWFPYVLALAVVLFAFSTMISWSYYGLKAWTYLVGEGPKRELAFKLFFCLAIIIGSAMNLKAVLLFSDAMVFAMAFVNIIGLYILAPVVKREVSGYLARVKSGEIKPKR